MSDKLLEIILKIETSSTLFRLDISKQKLNSYFSSLQNIQFINYYYITRIIFYDI